MCVCACVCVCVCVCACVCVCMCVVVVVVVVASLNQPVLTAIGSGLQGPQGPFSPCGDWDLIFIIGTV